VLSRLKAAMLELSLKNNRAQVKIKLALSVPIWHKSSVFTTAQEASYETQENRWNSLHIDMALSL